MTQCERVKAYMERFGSITTYQAFKDLGVTKLSNRISELRADGVRIAQKTETGRNRFGDHCKFMRYWLEK